MSSTRTNTQHGSVNQHYQDTRVSTSMLPSGLQQQIWLQSYLTPTYLPYWIPITLNRVETCLLGGRGCEVVCVGVGHCLYGCVCVCVFSPKIQLPSVYTQYSIDTSPVSTLKGTHNVQYINPHWTHFPNQPPTVFSGRKKHVTAVYDIAFIPLPLYHPSCQKLSQDRVHCSC